MIKNRARTTSRRAVPLWRYPEDLVSVSLLVKYQTPIYTKCHLRQVFATPLFYILFRRPFYKSVMMSTTQDDPFDSLLTLEDTFYKEGYDLGVSDGTRAGLIEGRLFGLEKGFEKYASMGKLYGRAVIWTGRLPISREVHVPESQDATAADTKSIESLSGQKTGRGDVQPQIAELPGQTSVPGLAANKRLEKQIRTLYALTEPESLSTDNDEISVSEFDDRFTRAEGKIKVIERVTGETTSQDVLGNFPSNASGLEAKYGKFKRGDGGIEDISSLVHARG